MGTHSAERTRFKKEEENLPSTMERVSSPSTKGNSVSVGDGARGAKPNGFAGEGRNTTAVMSLKVPSKRSNHGIESDDDEVDEIGSLIYAQVMRRR